MSGVRYKSGPADAWTVDELADARVAITGASSGIGAALAEAFGRRGASVALCARRRDALERVAEAAKEQGAEATHVQTVDVTEQDQLQAWADALGTAWSGIDVAVANAGVGQYGPFLEMSAEDLEQVASTNLTGTWHTVRSLADLIDDGGQVQVVGSMIARVPTPYMSTYAATKAALVSWTRSVRPEMKRRGIDLTLVLPGATRTDFAVNTVRAEGTSIRDLKAALERGWSPKRVAEACVEAAKRRPKELPLTGTGRIGWALGSLAPNLVAGALERPMRPGDETKGI